MPHKGSKPYKSKPGHKKPAKGAKRKSTTKKIHDALTSFDRKKKKLGL